MLGKARIASPLVALIAFAHPVRAAAPLTPRDFAYGMTVQGVGDEPVQTVLLPPPVYQGVLSGDLHDVRVFNGQGEQVPHAIRTLDRAEPSERTLAPLPFFPLPGELGTAGDLSVWVTRSGAGAILELRQSAPSAGPQRAYLIDLSADERRFKELRLSWGSDGVGPQGFLARVRVEASDDLVSWHSVADTAVVAELQYQGHSLRRDAIPLAGSGIKARYLRVSTTHEPFPVSLSGIAGEPVAPTPEPTRHTTVVDPQVPEPGVFVFDVRGPLPLDRISFHLPQVNTLVQAVLSSAHQPEGPYTERHRGLLYRVSQQGQEWSSPALRLSPQRHRYWRLQVSDRGGGLGTGAPRLAGEWLSEQLLFVARGAGPFTVAYGSAAADDGSFAPAELMSLVPGQRLDALDQFSAELGSETTLGGAHALVVPPPPTPWTQWLLWALLVAGVGMLGLMAYRLVQALGDPDPQKPKMDG